ncbi:serine hydrolase domain-containing protein [Microbacterium sp. NPDC058345]|uniref:serine hydrolase domain-containing protein n=1 Tax=Microbacterium sp. NPDC058345 TaxID=3346455 RepID=UPI0036684854
MSGLESLLKQYVSDGTLPGAVALVGSSDRVEVAVAGSRDIEGTSPMTRDSIFRVASITKTAVATVVMMLVDDGRIGLNDPIAQWLPEMAAPMVARTPQSALDDVVSAVRPITVSDLLTSRAGWGWPSDFSYPAVQALFSVQRDGRRLSLYPATQEEWLSELAAVPLLYQPGEAWLYDTCSVLQGILISRVTGQSLADVMTERLFEPLGMVDTGFHVPAAKRDRMTTFYLYDADGRIEHVDGPDGDWSRPPTFPLGHGGLVSTIDDWYAFARFLLAEGHVAEKQLLSAEAVRQMTTNHLTPAQREIGQLFLDGQGWGFGGTVDVEPSQPWHVPGRYGWVGGTGTSAHIVPSARSIAVFFTQRGGGPGTPSWLSDFWTYATHA